jgi:hypothetical protein
LFRGELFFHSKVNQLCSNAGNTVSFYVSVPNLLKKGPCGYARAYMGGRVPVFAQARHPIGASISFEVPIVANNLWAHAHHIRSGTRMPSNPRACPITLATASERATLNFNLDGSVSLKMGMD